VTHQKPKEQESSWSKENKENVASEKPKAPPLVG
jgi:hypothetical protein